jgi:O-antigen/teichoic acid export membrane protein
MSEDSGPNSGRMESRPGETLTSRTLFGAAWIFSGAAAQSVLKILVLAILGRLLTPSAFGVVGAALVVVAFADTFGKLGVAPAIVQVQTLNRRLLRTGFTLTLVFGIAVGLAIWFLAPWCASLFRIEELEPVLRMLALIFPLRSLGFVAEALLQRRMQFRALAVISLVSYALGYAGVAVTLAWAGFGVMALVLGQIAQSAVATLGFVACARHPMLPLADRESLKALGRFGSGVKLARLGNYVAMHADYFVVGRWLGVEMLGYYSRAYSLMMQPTNVIGGMGDKVLYPALATVQTENERLLRGFYRSISLIAIATLPLSGVVIAAAPEVVQLLLGGQWGEVVLPLQILMLVLVFRTAVKPVGALLRAKGAVYLLAGWQWLYALMIAAGAWLGHPYGISGVAAVVAFAVVVNFWIGLAITRLIVPISLTRVLLTLARFGILAVAVSVPVALIRGPMMEAGVQLPLVLLAEGAIAGLVGLLLWIFVPVQFGEERRWINGFLAERATQFMVRFRRAT